MSVFLPRYGNVIKVWESVSTCSQNPNNAGPGGLLHFLGGKGGAGVGEDGGGGKDFPWNHVYVQR